MKCIQYGLYIWTSNFQECMESGSACNNFQLQSEDLDFSFVGGRCPEVLDGGP